ncbi:MAG: hypothetical protein ACFE0J_11525 [Elainellaceae cyanobacterium]
MTEENKPNNHSDFSQFADFASLGLPFNLGDPNPDNESTFGESSASSPRLDDWQTVDFPQAISIDAIHRQSLYTQEIMQSNPPDGHPNSPNEDMSQLNNAELVQLIQELNQCNHALMERITRLEHELEQGQQALQSEVVRSQEAESTRLASSGSSAAQGQVDYLLNQLEYAQQTHQRQEILIETLNHQLQASQERVVQIEQDYARLQKSHAEQSRELKQSEHLCRDLQMRLQRQQRYTMQFKVALEKCLEVPPPSYESSQGQVQEQSHVDPILSNLQGTVLTQPFLPKVHHIKPWSTQSDSRAAADEPQSISSEQNPDLTAPVEIGDASTREATHSSPLSFTAAPRLSQAQARFQATLSELARASVDPPNEAIAPSSAIPSEPSTPSSPPTHSPMQSVGSPPHQPPISESPDSSHIADSATASETVGLTTDLETAMHALQKSDIVDSSSSTDDDALWRDLAKLVDASADDVLKAQSAQDFETFSGTDVPPSIFSKPGHPLSRSSQSEDQSAGSPSPQESQSPPLSSSRSIDLPDPNHSKSVPLTGSPSIPAHDSSSSETSAPDTQQQKNSNSSEQAAPALNRVTCPSPLVYPARPLKKRASLAAVDLPTFPRK